LNAAMGVAALVLFAVFVYPPIVTRLAEGSLF
jgi:hypothetical protein